MALEDVYKTFYHDNSGSISKNRFGYEMAVGIEKMIEHYDMYDDYSIVFDYVCDVEFHYENKENSIMKFYQVKTRDSIKPFDTTFLTSKGKKKNSVVGTLYKLYKPTDNCEIKLYIVGNLPFKDADNLIKDINGFSFSRMSEKTKKNILKHLKEEQLIEDDVELDDLIYIYNPLNIINYDVTMLGKLINFYNEKIDKNIIKPKVLYSTLKDLVMEKACYEKSNDLYNEIVKNKGIKKSEFTKLLLEHKQRSNNIIEKCILEYKNINPNNISESLKIKRALTKIIQNNDNEARKIMNTISKNIENEIDKFYGNLNDFIVQYIKKYDDIFSVDNDYYEKYAYVLYQYVKIAEVEDE